MCPCGKAVESRTHIVGECEIYKQERDALEKEKEHARMCPCGKAVESRTHIAGECEIYKKERDVLEGEVRKIDECVMEKSGTLDSSPKTIAILGDRW